VVQIGHIIKKSHKKILKLLFGSGHVIAAAAAVAAPVIAPILVPVAAAAPLIAPAALSEADRLGRNRYWSKDNEGVCNYESEIAENQAETERFGDKLKEALEIVKSSKFFNKNILKLSKAKL
jgi:hypothetical protein